MNFFYQSFLTFLLHPKSTKGTVKLETFFAKRLCYQKNQKWLTQNQLQD